MLAATDGEPHSYLELADALRAGGGDVRADLPQLWSRIAFNILVSNTDDHLRNHGFLWAPGGWRLAPAYDLDPTPVDVKPRVHALAIDEADPTASIERALAVAPSFALDAAAARKRLAAVARAVGTWRAVAKQHGLSAAQVERMASAFEHDDAALAAKLARR